MGHSRMSHVKAIADMSVLVCVHLLLLLAVFITTIKTIQCSIMCCIILIHTSLMLFPFSSMSTKTYSSEPGACIEVMKR